jgi:hypothetical protein
MVTQLTVALSLLSVVKPVVGVLVTNLVRSIIALWKISYEPDSPKKVPVITVVEN